MSGTSSVGNSQVYEDGDQKNVTRSEIEQEKKDNRFHEGKENSHKANDSSEEPGVLVAATVLTDIARGPEIHCKQASSGRKGTNTHLAADSSLFNHSSPFLTRHIA
jgi:hypothetical protein